jgi:hypothetical protein
MGNGRGIIPRIADTLASCSSRIVAGNQYPKSFAPSSLRNKKRADLPVPGVVVNGKSGLQPEIGLIHRLSRASAVGGIDFIPNRPACRSGYQALQPYQNCRDSIPSHGSQSKPTHKVFPHNSLRACGVFSRGLTPWMFSTIGLVPVHAEQRSI